MQECAANAVKEMKTYLSMFSRCNEMVDAIEAIIKEMLETWDKEQWDRVIG